LTINLPAPYAGTDEVANPPAVAGLRRNGRQDSAEYPLLGELQGYRDLRAAGQRYRIIYTVEEDRVVVLVVYVGMRKDGDKNDVYAIAKKLLRAGLIDPK
jgi:hypothetical protein